ncbi:MAG: hypothetical protein KIT14_06765 [bacterium]|nr:hypothetical protein [bacterium]
MRAPFVIAWRDADGDRGEARGTAAFAIARRDGGARIVGLEWALLPDATRPGPAR